MKNLLVLQTDFGLGDGAVAAMHGVAVGVSDDLRIYNLTHEIEPYNIWDASYRLVQTITYWPAGTVFVSVVDPGVGSDRKSVVAETASGHFIVTPDNGTLTHIHKNIGVVALREIDEEINRLPYSGESYTFHGRDIYAYTGARLATGVIGYEGVGPELPLTDLVTMDTGDIVITEETLTGMVDILDIRFGNLWTNIPKTKFDEFGVAYGDKLQLSVSYENRQVYSNEIKFVTSFAEVNIGEALVYMNSLDNMGIAINQGSFAAAYQIGTGDKWIIRFKKIAQ